MLVLLCVLLMPMILMIHGMVERWNLIFVVSVEIGVMF